MDIARPPSPSTFAAQTRVVEEDADDGWSNYAIDVQGVSGRGAQVQIAEDAMSVIPASPSEDVETVSPKTVLPHEQDQDWGLNTAAAVESVVAEVTEARPEADANGPAACETEHLRIMPEGRPLSNPEASRCDLLAS